MKNDKSDPDFKGFANDIITSHFAGEDIDGSDVQDLAIRYNLFKVVTVTEECRDDCACAEFGFPSECCRKNYS